LEEIDMKRLRDAVITVLTVGMMSGCASTSVRTVETDISGQLPRPDRVLVYDFAVSPEEVQLDRGLSARAVAATQGTSRTEQEIATGRKVASTLSDHLVQEIRKLGLDAERAAGAVQQESRDLAITGHFLSIDEGNRTERVVIGLGAGRTDVQAEVLVHQQGLVLEKLVTDAKSGVKPGMAETMGAGALELPKPLAPTWRRTQPAPRRSLRSSWRSSSPVKGGFLSPNRSKQPI
jgi:hypothetical protein